MVGEWDEEENRWRYPDHVEVSANYQYDIQGRILYYTITRSKGDCSNDAFFEYHEDGNYTQHINIFGKDNKLISWCNLDFDKDKHLLCLEVHLWQDNYGFNYEYVERNEFTYDEQGRKTGQRWLQGGQEQGERYEYNDTPEKTVINYYNGWNNLNPQESQMEILYDEHGYEIERRQYDGDKLRYTVKSEYRLLS